MVFTFRRLSQLSVWLGLCLALGALLSGGCISRKRIAYFQNLPAGESKFYPKPAPYHLQPGDVVKVAYSGPDPTALVPFGSESSVGQGNTVSNLQMFLTGYSVSDSGTIYLPVLGSVPAGNKTLAELEELIQQRLNVYVRNATAKVRLVSFKVAVLGEVRVPGTYYVYNDVLTLPEALGYAGDMNENADRKNVRLIRRVQGVVQMRTLDLTDPKILGSEDFYLKPNDVVYAVPVAQKASRLNLPVTAIGLSGFTTVLVLFSLFRK